MQEIECKNCGWEGSWTDTVHRYEKIEDYCPKCGSKELIDHEAEKDAVDPEDYREQERGSRWK